MSIVFNGSTQYATRTESPSASDFAMALWLRRDVDGAAVENPIAIDDGSYFQQTVLRIDIQDQLLAEHFDQQTANAVNPLIAGTWYWVMIRYAGNTLTLRHITDGQTDWESNVTLGGLTDLTPDRITIGACRGNGTNPFPGTIACAKIWSATPPSDTQLLSERLTTDVITSTGIWASYSFLDGSLGEDVSGNDRTLTLINSPSYISDQPTDLTISGVLDRNTTIVSKNTTIGKQMFVNQVPKTRGLITIN